ncbi:hypothetical protein [Spirosoma sp.]|uniref:hypothetical protein n=1 Tax=Spirosoma sp. TaxID=1899569 RepID=UPI0026285A01|nr:hypothetical protein [Spirosoma sp.]MCX6214173.1 hypothetical protein [Spirosoma sp.]
MKTYLTTTKSGYLAILLVIACPFVSSQSEAMPSINAFTVVSTKANAPSIDTQTRPVKLEKDAVLVRNAPAKADPVAPAAASKKTEEKKTISRCWKRLMNMAREIRHAHSGSKK